MPLYEYKCKKCGAVFERLQRFSDEPLQVHEACGGPVERLVSAAAFQFKGSGWYVTDYASKSGGNGKSGSEKPKPESSTTPAKSESSAPAPPKTGSKS